MNKKAETLRDRRVSRDEEKRLLDTALHKMNDGVHMFVGELLHDRIIGALELCCRRGERLLIQNKRVNWDTSAFAHFASYGATCADCLVARTRSAFPGDRERQREPPHSVQSERTAGGDPETPGDARSRGLRVRQHARRLSGDDSNGSDVPL
jgi:hypothetical protein